MHEMQVCFYGYLTCDQGIYAENVYYAMCLIFFFFDIVPVESLIMMC
jgi:hypothetical protein